MIQNRLNDKEKEIQGLKKQASFLVDSAWEKGYVAGFDDGYNTGRQEERPHGEWIEHYDTEDGFTWLTCSRCMFKAYEDDYNFCPNCGAEMRKEIHNARK